MEANEQRSRPPARARATGFARRRVAFVVVLVTAAALLAYLYLARNDDAQPVLPDYAISANGAAHGRLEVRGGGDAPFELVLRPAARVPTKVVAYVFAIGEGEPNAVDAMVGIDPEGVVRIDGRARALAGAREVRVVLGAASGFKRYEDALSRARVGTSDGRVRVLALPIVRVNREGP